MLELLHLVVGNSFKQLEIVARFDHSHWSEDAAWNYYSGVPLFRRSLQEAAMNGIIYLIGLIVVILAILSFFGLH